RDESYSISCSIKVNLKGKKSRTMLSVPSQPRLRGSSFGLQRRRKPHRVRMEGNFPIFAQAKPPSETVDIFHASPEVSSQASRHGRVLKPHEAARGIGGTKVGDHEDREGDHEAFRSGITGTTRSKG
ncbi:unnamed protein product, partial [Amoebophrya sp. A25]